MEMDDANLTVHRRADHWDAEGAGGGSEDRRLKALEQENARLKKLLAEQMLDNAILKDVASKNGDARREA